MGWLFVRALHCERQGVLTWFSGVPSAIIFFCLLVAHAEPRVLSGLAAMNMFMTLTGLHVGHQSIALLGNIDVQPASCGTGMISNL
jgi:hypothetical protein